MFLYNALVINITFVILHTIGAQLIIPKQCLSKWHLTPVTGRNISSDASTL